MDYKMHNLYHPVMGHLIAKFKNFNEGICSNKLQIIKTNANKLVFAYCMNGWNLIWMSRDDKLDTYVNLSTL